MKILIITHATEKSYIFLIFGGINRGIFFSYNKRLRNQLALVFAKLSSKLHVLEYS